MSEKLLEDYLVQQAAKHGLDALKLALIGKRGFPDRTIIGPNGKIAFCEMKTKSGVLSKPQIFWGKVLTANGFNYSVVDSKEGVDDFLMGVLV